MKHSQLVDDLPFETDSLPVGVLKVFLCGLLALVVTALLVGVPIITLIALLWFRRPFFRFLKWLFVDELKFLRWKFDTLSESLTPPVETVESIENQLMQMYLGPNPTDPNRPCG